MDGLYLRKAEYSDLDLLFKWANDATVRNNSFNTEPIPYEDHVKWFERMMRDETVLQFIMMKGEMPVGQIRLSVNENEAEIGYSIAKEFRGNGYGHAMIGLIAKVVAKEYPQITKLVAKVKPDNVASNKLFEKEKYQLSYCCYTLDINC